MDLLLNNRYKKSFGSDVLVWFAFEKQMLNQSFKEFWHSAIV